MSIPQIHPTAIVGQRVVLGDQVTVGPYAIIEDDVKVGDRTTIGPHAFIGRLTQIGTDNEIGLGAQVGGAPQIVGWQEVDSRVIVGNHNVIREYATIHRAKFDGVATEIGNHCYLMSTAHVAHDCKIGDHVVICNGSLVAGHVTVGDHAFISGNCPIHQFCRIGRYAMIRGLTAVGKDVVPFTLIDQTNTMRGLNTVGLRRSDISADSRKAIKAAYRAIFKSSKLMTEALAEMKGQPMCDEVREMVEFIRTSERGVCLTRSTALRGSQSESDESE